MQIEETVKKINKIRNRAEAFLNAAYKYGRVAELDSENWEEGLNKRLYRIKLKSRDIFRVVLNSVLYDIEIKNLTDPLTFGIYKADLRNKSSFELADLTSVPCTVSSLKAFDDFASSRKRLFDALQESDLTGVIEIFDLRQFKEQILDYVGKYIVLLNEIQDRLKTASNDSEINNIMNAGKNINRIDTIELDIGVNDDYEKVVLLAPTHPIRLLWVLQYQQLLFSWADRLDGLTTDQIYELINLESIQKITSLNIPGALSFGQGEIYINTDNIDLYWSIFPGGGSKDVRKTVTLLLRLLGYKGDAEAGQITSITPAQLSDKIWRYLKHHPYVSTLKINVINPGDGLLVLNSIREIQKDKGYQESKFDIAFYGDMGYEVMGSSFDDLMEEAFSSEGQSDVDEILLKPNANPLFPKLTFSKQRLRENDWKDRVLREAHITILIDRFSTKVLTRKINDGVGSFCLNNLLCEYKTNFSLEGDSATWSRKIIPGKNSEIFEGDNVSEHIYFANDFQLRLGACFYDWGNSLDKVPTIQLELSDADKHIISKIHENSDWIFTIDSNFGIEYFDNPLSASGASKRSYLIDYSPEFLDGIGHRLIVSTFWLSEIKGLIKDGLRKMGFESTGFHAEQILDILKSISGRLALKLINNPNDAKEIIGLALTRLLLEESNELKSSILIPVDSHVGLFAERKRQLQDAEIRLYRTDLILVKSKDDALELKLIEVKYRSGSGLPSEILELKEAIVEKNKNTKTVIETKFGAKKENDRLDKDIHNKQLANLLQFYLSRSERYGLVDYGRDETKNLLSILRKIEDGSVEISFSKAGYIFNLKGISHQPSLYKGNEIVVVGEEKICELLDISPREAAEDIVTPTIVEKVEERKQTAAEETKHQLTEKQEETAETIDQKPTETVIKKEVREQISAPSEIIEVYLGENVDTNKEVYWNPTTNKPKKLTNQHILIVGKSGAGKTQTIASFLWDLTEHNVPSVIFDFQGEYMSTSLVNGNDDTFVRCTRSQVLDASEGIPVNPLEIPIDPHTGDRQNYLKTVYQVSTSLSKIFGLGDIQKAILREAIANAYTNCGFIVSDKNTWNNPAPKFSDIWKILKHLESTEGGNVRNLNYRVLPLFETEVFIENDSPTSFEEILGRNTILRLSNLATTELMVAVSRFMLQKIYSHMLSLGPCNDLRIFAVVDEAHKLSYEETLTELIREARKYGVGILLASQSVKDFDRVVFNMVGTKIALQLEGDDAKIMSDNMGLISKNDRDIARSLILNQSPLCALIRSNHFEPYQQVKINAFFEKTAPN